MSSPPATPYNTLAVVSLVAGIAAWMPIPLLGGLVAIITGHIALHQLKTSPERGRDLAIGGLVLGYLHMALVVVMLGIFLLVFLGVGAAIFSGAKP